MSIFDQMQHQIVRNVEYANRFKNKLSLSSCICIITNVNAADFTVDVTIPSNNSKLFNVQIATNITGGDISLHMLPAKNQKGILLLSSQHSPMLIATIPNKKQGYNDSILEKEAFIGTQLSFLKIGNDESTLLKTPSSSISLSSESANILAHQHILSSNNYRVEHMTNQKTGSGFSKEVYYLDEGSAPSIQKENVIKDGQIDTSIKESVLSENQSLINKMQLMIDALDEFVDNTELGNISAVDKLDELNTYFQSHFISTGQKPAIIVEKGDSYYNNDNGYIYSVRRNSKEEDVLCFAISKDGTIIQNP